MLYSTFKKEEMPQASFCTPTLVLRPPRIRTSRSPPSSPRHTVEAETTSTPSDSRWPAAWHSMASISNGEMPACRMASAMASCSAGPLGACSPAERPLLVMRQPTMVPMQGPSITESSPELFFSA
eukprot:Skav209246  [mRNA]  locus=scaffold990:4471:7980:- [translate_table: standard]